MLSDLLANGAFASYRDIIDHGCRAWNGLVDQPWKTMSIGIGMRKWAHR